jgi:diguanylate cyclase (GGDEF)-like protein
MDAGIPLRALVIGPDQHRIVSAARRLEALGISCDTALISSTALRAGMRRAPDVIVALEVGGSWQPTWRILESAMDGAGNGAAGMPGPPVMVLSEGTVTSERADALCSRGSDMWDWVEASVPEREIAARLGRLARVRRMAAQIDDLTRRCDMMETVDRLTGLSNHRAFQEFLAGEFRRAERYSSALSVLLCDLDRFRSYNEAHGHLQGDRVLQRIAGGLRSVVRDVDLAARYGGEQFALILTQADQQGAATVAGRVQEIVKEVVSRLEPCAGETAEIATSSRLTASIGLASYPVEGTATRGQLLAAAEGALRRAKDGGRNRIVAHAARAGTNPPLPEQPGTGATTSLSPGWSG